MFNDPSSEYVLLAKDLSDKAQKLRSTINRMSVLRLLVFALTILLVYLFFKAGLTVVSIIFLLGIIAFLFLVKKHVARQQELLFLETKLLLINNEVSVAAEGPNLYKNGDEYENAAHPYVSDLDIFGQNSLFAYLNRCNTTEGMQVLSGWLQSVHSLSDISERQKAVAEIAAFQEELLNFRTRQRIVPQEQHQQAQRFLNARLSEKLSFLGNRFLSLFLKALPFVSIALFLTALVLNGIWWNVLGIWLFINAAVYFSKKKKIDHVHESSTRLRELLQNYAENLQWLETQPWQSSLLLRRREEVTRQGAVSASLKKLSFIIRDLDYRLNIIIGMFLNLFFLWDLRCLVRLSHWEKLHFGQLREALYWISEFEALTSLSIFDHNHPDWIYPLVQEKEILITEGLGHPLITKKERVLNDFSFRDTVTTDIITGSNMAGKSTFLRTVGINLVLAYAGAKVCALRFECGIFKLVSYMRIKDSLAGKTSTFKAEIDRLKMILDYSQQHSNALVLIDEMLRGTNSKDKYLGSKAFIEKLIDQGTHAFVATHDLQVAELEKTYPQQLRNFHFDISLTGNQEMYFDYKIKTGECKTFNASILLKTIGLEISESGVE